MSAALLSMARCPNCGAPLSVERDRRSVICLYCNASLRAEEPAAGESAPRLAADAVSPDDIERVKQLLLDGKREEAIAHYARVAAVPRDEAERAVENVFLSAYWTLVRHLPLNAFGFFLHLALVSLGAVPAVWAATRAQENPAFYALAVAFALFAFYQGYRLWQHLRTTLVLWFGAKGRGRVLRRSVVREVKERGGAFVVVLFEVVPDDGSAAFVDQETLFVREQAVQKLSPGNVIPVRFDGARAHVFPIRPITVVGVV